MGFHVEPPDNQPVPNANDVQAMAIKPDDSARVSPARKKTTTGIP
jgi:hypothetical protein